MPSCRLSTGQMQRTPQRDRLQGSQSRACKDMKELFHRMDDVPFRTDHILESLLGKILVLSGLPRLPVRIPYRLGRSLVHVVVVLPQTELGPFLLAVEPVVPLQAFYAFKSLDLEPAVGETGRLFGKQFLVIGVIMLPRYMFSGVLTHLSSTSRFFMETLGDCME